MKHFTNPAFLVLLPILSFAACSGQTLDGGSNTPGPDAGQTSADAAGGTSSGAPGTGTRTLGEGCTDNGECAGGLECLPFAVHPQGEDCKVVSKMCTKACVSGETDGCDGLGAPAMCFAGCAEDEAVCGKTGTAPGGDKVTFTIADAPAALTSSADDVLFVLTVKTLSPVRPYVASSVAVIVDIPGRSGMIVPCAHGDTNTDGNLDIGETLTCSEPPVDEFDATLVGKSLTVSLAERSDPSGPYQSRGTGVWKPSN
jgi:hypothetical protein